MIDVLREVMFFLLICIMVRATGIPIDTAGINDLGNPVRDSSCGMVRGLFGYFEGVQADGCENTIRARLMHISGAFYWGNATRNPAQMTVYDASLY